MQKKTICSFLLIIFISVFDLTHCMYDANWDTSPYFNTNFLAQYELVEQILIHQAGFKPITITTSDNLNLQGLLLQTPNAKGTIVFCAGFLPGRKELQAPIFKMIPQNYNIFCFDARGHGASEGSFFCNLSEYGKHEYKDVLAAINFVKQTIGGNIIIYGVCTGAFHAAHALIKMEESNCLTSSNIKGLIFDSSFVSFLEVLKAGKFHLREKFLPNILNWYADKKRIRDTYFYKLCAFGLTEFGLFYQNRFVLPGLQAIESETNLLDKMHKITCPILFIHSKDDNYAPFEQTMALAESTENKICWWIEKSPHAAHALKHKHEFRERLLGFCELVM